VEAHSVADSGNRFQSSAPDRASFARRLPERSLPSVERGRLPGPAKRKQPALGWTPTLEAVAMGCPVSRAERPEAFALGADLTDTPGVECNDRAKTIKERGGTVLDM
jgi:hypothetical protein